MLFVFEMHKYKIVISNDCSSSIKHCDDSRSSIAHCDDCRSSTTHCDDCSSSIVYCDDCRSSYLKKNTIFHLKNRQDKIDNIFQSRK